MSLNKHSAFIQNLNNCIIYIFTKDTESIILFPYTTTEGVATLVSRKWLWFIMDTVTSAFSACLSGGRCPAAEPDVLTLSRWVLTAENFLEGKSYTKLLRH